MKLGRPRRPVLTYQSNRKRRFNLMAVDPTQFVQYSGGVTNSRPIGGSSTNGLTLVAGQAGWAFAESSATGGLVMQVPAGLYYAQLTGSFDFPFSGANSPQLTVSGYNSDGSSVTNAQPVVPGATVASVAITAYTDGTGFDFTSAPGAFVIYVVQIAPLA